MAQFIIEGIGERDLYYEAKSLENFLGTFCDSDLVELRDLLLREFPVPLNEHERQRLADHDYGGAAIDHHKAFEVMASGLGGLIEDAQKEVCLPTERCRDCGAPTQHMCRCEEDVVF